MPLNDYLVGERVRHIIAEVNVFVEYLQAFGEEWKTFIAPPDELPEGLLHTLTSNGDTSVAVIAGEVIANGINALMKLGHLQYEIPKGGNGTVWWARRDSNPHIRKDTRF